MANIAIFEPGAIVRCTVENSPIGNAWYGIVAGDQCDAAPGEVFVHMVERNERKFRAEQANPNDYQTCGGQLFDALDLLPAGVAPAFAAMLRTIVDGWDEVCPAHQTGE